jgi:hypothetical protein
LFWFPGRYIRISRLFCSLRYSCGFFFSACVFMTLAFSILLGYYVYLDIYYISFTLLILVSQLILFCDALSYLISSFNFLISMISGLIVLYILVFIFNILSILDILPTSIVGITLGDNLVIEENIEFPELARNSYISSLFF